MPERRRHEPRAANLDCSTGTAARPARLALEVAERRVDGCVVRVAELLGGLGVDDARQDADRLRCAERQIEPGHRPVTDGLTKTAAGQQVLERLRFDSSAQPAAALALPAQRPGAAAGPLAARHYTGAIPGRCSGALG